jgi:AAA+ superfamily predicted ATPase
MKNGVQTESGVYLHYYFALLALRLHREVARVRLMRGAGADESFLGLFLSEADVDRLLNGLHGITITRGDRTSGLEDEIKRLESRLAETPVPRRLSHLVNLFGLTPAAVDVLLMLLAAEVDSRFGRVYAYLHDDVTRRRLSPGLALRLIPGLSPKDSAGRALFSPGSPMLDEALVTMVKEENGLPVPLIERPLKLDDRIAEYLLGNDALDPALNGIVTIEESPSAPRDLVFPAAFRKRLEHLFDLWRQPEPPPAVFYGPPGSGKRTAASLLASVLDRPLLCLDAVRIEDQPPAGLTDLLRRALREARLRKAILYVSHVDAAGKSIRPILSTLLRPGVILSSRTLPELPPSASIPVTLAFDVPDHYTRELIWKKSLDGAATDDLVAELAGSFRLTPGQIGQAVKAAERQAKLERGVNAGPERDDLFLGCRILSSPSLERLARKVNSPFTWSDLVLPDVQMRELHAIEAQFRHRHTVNDAWGFGEKMALGKGLNALFSGPSGTGKTMAAGILARSLGLDLYKIDLSAVVSKYIGETEKNLRGIFDEAEGSSAILFFDEADALFGKRSEVKDAHDRYANIEVSYLLQRMEEYEGIAILATNFSQNLDEAFTRRMQFLVEFPLPQPLDRERIWRSLLPPNAPVEDDLDFAFLASQFDLAGGHIKNSVLAGAYLAAEEGSAIGMRHLVQGVARELARLGRPIKKTGFGDFYTMVRRNT